MGTWSVVDRGMYVVCCLMVLVRACVASLDSFVSSIMGVISVDEFDADLSLQYTVSAFVWHNV